MDYVQRTFRLHEDTVRRLDDYSKRTGVTRTFAVEKAITEYLSREDAAANAGDACEKDGGTA